jgi:hypothetical protein
MPKSLEIRKARKTSRNGTIKVIMGKINCSYVARKSAGRYGSPQLIPAKIQVAKLGYSTDIRNRSFQAAVPQTQFQKCHDVAIRWRN